MNGCFCRPCRGLWIRWVVFPGFRWPSAALHPGLTSDAPAGAETTEHHTTLETPRKGAARSECDSLIGFLYE